jgi:large subunit ribosomal protein L10
VEKSEKLEFVQNLKSNLESAELLIVTQPKGLTVSEVSDLRKKMREAGATYKVVKNSLARIALKDTLFAGISEDIKGPIAFAYSADPVAAAKAAVGYA